MTNTFNIGEISVGGTNRFFAIIGPCQIEGLDHALRCADKISTIAKHADVEFIYKSSFDKANRSSLNTARGVGIEEGLRILETVRSEFGCPILTDVHAADQCAQVGEVVDVIQIPAFLCRQTDLLLAAAKTGAAINVKKGQFMAPWDMGNVAEKLQSTGSQRIMLCDRGTSFGYNTLVSDFRSLPVMAQTGCPVVFDATHSVQQPGGQGATSGGERKFVPALARAAVAVGCDGIFIEAHEDPDNAPSDGPNMVPFDELEPLLRSLKNIENARLKG